LARSVPKFTGGVTASRLCRQAGRGKAGGSIKIIEGQVRVAATRHRARRRWRGGAGRGAATARTCVAAGGAEGAARR
jgi:hypothetical protein